MILRAPGLHSAFPHANPRPRAGFTLLEILLAALIAILLMGALYAAFTTTLKQTQSSRDAMEVEDLARGVFNKMTIDLSGTLAPMPPKSGGNSAASGGTNATGTTTSTPSTGSTTPATGATGATGAASTATPTTGTVDPTTGTISDNATAYTAAPIFQGGVYCQDPTVLVLFLGRTPETFGRYSAVSQVRSDQRQVIYKFVEGRGLYRAERPWVTADSLTMDLDPDNPESVLLADEVTGVLFEFFDGTAGGTAATTWDGTVPGPDGVTPLGAPRAIRVTLTLSIPTGKGDMLTKTMAQMMVIRSAPGTFTPPLLEAPTDGASDGSATGTTAGSSGSTTPATGGSTGGSTGGATGGAAGGATGGKMPSLPSGLSLPSGGSGSMPALPSGGGAGGGGNMSGGGTGGGTGGRTGGGGTGGGTGGGKGGGP